MTTPSEGMRALSGAELLTRNTSPQDYPCFHVSGYYHPTEGCAEKCCAGRKALEEGAGEDARHAQLAMEAGIEAINRQPDFGDDDEVETPFKNHKAPESGTTPAGAIIDLHRHNAAARGNQRCIMALWQPGVAGWRQESPIKLYK